MTTTPPFNHCYACCKKPTGCECDCRECEEGKYYEGRQH